MKKKIKNTKCKGVKGNQMFFLFFIIIITPNNQDFNVANMKLHNIGALGLGTSRNVSGISNSSL